MTVPVLIVVCGAPASGKTTLARRLATDLRLPLLEKDVIKESLASALGVPDRGASKRIGAASFRVLYDLAFAMVAHGSTMMIEANLNRAFVAPELARLTTVATVVIVQCEAGRAVIERRYRDRASSGERHGAHFDMDAFPDLITALESKANDLTPLGYPTMVVHTDEGYQPQYDNILETLQQHCLAGC